MVSEAGSEDRSAVAISATTGEGLSDLRRAIGRLDGTPERA
jgi:hypothetical protein